MPQRRRLGSGFTGGSCISQRFLVDAGILRNNRAHLTSFFGNKLLEVKLNFFLDADDGTNKVVNHALRRIKIVAVIFGLVPCVVCRAQSSFCICGSGQKLIQNLVKNLFLPLAQYVALERQFF